MWPNIDNYVQLIIHYIQTIIHYIMMVWKWMDMILKNITQTHFKIIQSELFIKDKLTNTYNNCIPWHKSDFDLMKIYYMYKNTIYIVCYTDPSNIKFPPYSVHELENQKLGEERKFMLAMTDGKPLMDEITPYAGPKKNFYNDIGKTVKVSWIFEPEKLQKPLVILDSRSKMQEYKINDDLF